MAIQYLAYVEVLWGKYDGSTNFHTDDIGLFYNWKAWQYARNGY